MLDAILFDCDGVIVNTEPLHYRAFQRVLEPDGLGYSWEDYVSVYLGFDDREAFRERYRRAKRQLDDRTLKSLVDRKAVLFHHILAEDGIKPYPGVVELIRSISGQLPLALCTGALRSDIKPIFQALDLEHAFDVIVTAEDVETSKPDPACYRLALQRLQQAFPKQGIQPSCSLAIEDTPSGITAAKGAGLKVLVVPNSYPRDRLAKADRVIESLKGITLESLRRDFQ
jgi:HAD superfamily hydrolase (TIGR01509 family)